MEQLLQKSKLVIAIILTLLLCGCIKKKEVAIRAFIPKDVAISKNIAINTNDEVGTKGVEMILAPIATGVTKGFLSSRTDIRKNCIEYNIVVYEGNNLKFLNVDFLNGRIIFERNGK